MEQREGGFQGLHVAIIMDGNGRWAVGQAWPRIAGHRAGVIAARRIVECSANWGLRALTLYAFSSDNWRRPAFEVEGIFRLLRLFLRLEAQRLWRNGVRLQVIGRRDRLPAAVLREIEEVEALTEHGRGLRLRVAIDYSSRHAISGAVAEAMTEINGETRPRPEVVRTMLTQALTAEAGNVDLLIRTGGEKRLSDFLLWESAYAELVFNDCMWPEFDEAEFRSALEKFGRRERRFGALAPVVRTA